MTDRPIIFSAPMVRALLDGRKTQTRRVLKLPTKTHSGGPIYEHPKMGGWAVSTIGGHGCYLDREHTIPAPERACIWHQTTGCTVVPAYAPGDRLYVREAWSGEHYWHATAPKERQSGCWGGEVYVKESIWYWADGNPEFGDWERPRPSIHMPRWASRLTLIVSEVRVQRLQEISREDAIAEGIEGDTDGWFDYLLPATQCCARPQDSYATLWNSLHGPDAWDANPWVVALTFTVRHGNIDRIGGAK